MVRKTPGYFTLIVDTAPTAARDSSEVALVMKVVILTPETAGMVVSSLWIGPGNIHGLASSWMENPTEKDGLLLKHQLCPSAAMQEYWPPLFPVLSKWERYA